MIVTWNLTRHRFAYQNADVLVLSVGKCGRTWLRVMLNKYLSLHYGVPFSLEDLHGANPDIPSLFYDHWLWSHVRSTSIRRKVLGKFVIPRRLLNRKKVLFLFRDPRDVIVSVYFQATKRAAEENRFDCSLSDYLRHPRLGVYQVIRIMNLALQELEHHPHRCLVSYEALRSDTHAELARLLAFIGVGEVDAALVEQAVSFAAFEKMQRMERQGDFGSGILRPRDAEDPDSYKVRKGKVGGYLDYFNPADLAYVEEAMTTLDPAFGYRPAERSSAGAV